MGWHPSGPRFWSTSTSRSQWPTIFLLTAASEGSWVRGSAPGPPRRFSTPECGARSDYSGRYPAQGAPRGGCWRASQTKKGRVPSGVALYAASLTQAGSRVRRRPSWPLRVRAGRPGETTHRPCHRTGRGGHARFSTYVSSSAVKAGTRSCSASSSVLQARKKSGSSRIRYSYHDIPSSSRSRGPSHVQGCSRSSFVVIIWAASSF